MKKVKRILTLFLSLILIVSSIGVLNAHAVQSDELDERSLLLTMLSNIDINYTDENAKEIIADTLIDIQISNLDNLNSYLQALGYPSDELGNIIQVFEENPDAQNLLNQEEKQWAIRVLIKGTADEITHENHYLQVQMIQDMFSYYKEVYYDFLVDEFSELCDSSQINDLIQQIFVFYLDYCFFYRANLDGLLDIISNVSFNEYISQVPVNLVDLDNYTDSWKYENATISTEILEKNRAITNKADVVNISSSQTPQLDLSYILQLVDNGSILIVQNNDNIQTCSEMRSLLKMKSQDEVIEVENDATIPLGYSIRRDETGYKVETIFATVLKSASDDTFDLNKELENLKNSVEFYIDPIEFYYLKEKSINNIESTQKNFSSEKGTLQIDRESAYVEDSKGCYLYGKNGDAVWGYESGFKKFGYVEISAYIIEQYCKNGYDYDSVECFFTASALNGKNVEWYNVFNRIIRNSHMEWFHYINSQSDYTYGIEYTYGPDGLETSVTCTTTINPGDQCITTFKENEYVRWNCTPYSNGETWVVETSCLTKTAHNLKATTRVGFEEFVVDNWLLQYECPSPFYIDISY